LLHFSFEYRWVVGDWLTALFPSGSSLFPSGHATAFRYDWSRCKKRHAQKLATQFNNVPR
jgi:hypothetical protein